MNGKFLLRRLTAAAGALVLTVSLLFTYASAAAADTYVDLESTIRIHDAAFGHSEECTAIIEKAVSKRDIRALIIHFFLHNADYYRANGLNPDFPFFNADRYLQENPDVAMEAGNSRSDALEHYLTVGALEGRSSCTSFDPVIAISVLPEIGILTPEDLLSAWIQVMGTASTEDYFLSVTPADKYIATKKARALTPKKEQTAGGETISESGSGSGNSGPAPVVEDKSSYTLMVYLCGSDLESARTNNEATKALVKIILGTYDEENVNVVLCAGGANTWKNTYFDELLSVQPGEANKSAIFSINKEGVKTYVEEWIAQLDDVNTVDELYVKIKNTDIWEDYRKVADSFINEATLQLIGDVSTAAMGDPNTLVSLLNTASSGDFKADQYGLSLWNHGGGSLSGVCFPDDNESDSLEIKEIREALQTAGFGATTSSSENKLGLLAFDACLMAGAETAAYLSDYYDMMYASEETTYGDINYYGVINEANKRAGEDYLSYWLALQIIEDRLDYTGSGNRLTTGALFEGGKVSDSLEKLNAVARELNNLTQKDGDTAETVYKAFKNARLKCEQIGSNTTVDNCNDYVDMRNFLDMLKAEIDKADNLKENTELTEALNSAIAAADEATYANVFNYAGLEIYYHLKDSDPFWLGDEKHGNFWEEIKGMNLNGANIYVPYYGAKKESPTLEKDLNYFATNYAESLNMGDYNTFIRSFGEYLTSQHETERIQKLQDALTNGYDEKGTVAGYSELLEMTTKDTAAGKVLSIEVKDYDSVENQPSFSSGDAFVDLCETMDTMLVYITRNAKAIYSESNQDTQIDVVVGSKTITYENLNGLQSAVNIFTDQFNDAKVNVVSTGNQKYDFVVPSDIDGYRQKIDMIKKFYPEEEDPNTSDYLTVKGTAEVDGIGTPAYHLFKYDSDRNEYIYQGSTELTQSGGNLVVGDKLNTSAITFYHQVIHSATNKLVYAEECEWNDGSDTGKNLSLVGAKVFDTNDVISISSIDLQKIGSQSDNGYFFAVSKEQAVTDDDLFACGIAAPSDSDILDVIEQAMAAEPENDSGDSSGSPGKGISPVSEESSTAEGGTTVAPASEEMNVEDNGTASPDAESFAPVSESLVDSEPAPQSEQ